MNNQKSNNQNNTSTHNRKIALKVVAVFAAFTLLGIIMNISMPPSNTVQTPQSDLTAQSAVEQTPVAVNDSQPQTTIVIKSNSLVFTNFDDVKQFQDRLATYAKALQIPSSSSDLDNTSEDQATKVGQLMGVILKNMTIDFKEKGKILNVPVGTKITINDYFDSAGNKIKPVWNDPQKAFYTADGNLVYVSGEWQGENVITLWPYPSNSTDNN